jgi:TrpR-related protein YerC/YecD
MKANRPVSVRQEQQHERALCAAVMALASVEECRSFFRDLCTPAELQAMADRWAVVELLERGLPYREIHRQTGVSVTTIGRVARYLTSGNGGYRAVTTRLQAAESAAAGVTSPRAAGARAPGTRGPGTRSSAARSPAPRALIPRGA